MTTQSEFDRQLTAWLVDAAPQREPDGLLPRTMVHVRRSRRDPAWLVSLRGNAMGRRAKPASLVVALALLALLALAALGGAVIGSLGRAPDRPAAAAAIGHLGRVAPPGLRSARAIRVLQRSGWRP